MINSDDILSKHYINISFNDLIDDSKEILSSDDDYDDEILIDMINLDLESTGGEEISQRKSQSIKYKKDLAEQGLVWPPREEILYNGKKNMISGVE